MVVTLFLKYNYSIYIYISSIYNRTGIDQLPEQLEEDMK